MFIVFHTSSNYRPFWLYLRGHSEETKKNYESRELWGVWLANRIVIKLILSQSIFSFNLYVHKWHTLLEGELGSDEVWQKWKREGLGCHNVFVFILLFTFEVFRLSGRGSKKPQKMWTWITIITKSKSKVTIQIALEISFSHHFDFIRHLNFFILKWPEKRTSPCPWLLGVLHTMWNVTDL